MKDYGSCPTCGGGKARGAQHCRGCMVISRRPGSYADPALIGSRAVGECDESRGKGRNARRAWLREVGPIPDGLYVLHRCDNPRCSRVSHLFLGTHSDNTRDAMVKGIWWPPKPYGPKSEQMKQRLSATNTGRKLSEAHREAIRRAWVGRKARLPSQCRDNGKFATRPVG